MTDSLARERKAAQRFIEARRAQLAEASVLDEFFLRYARDLAASQPRCDETIGQMPSLTSLLTTDLIPVFRDNITYSSPVGSLPSISVIAANTNLGALTVYNVVFYGADPTGTKDSTTAIQSAINAANGDGIVFFPAGTYTVSSVLALTNNSILIGQGRRISVIQAAANYPQQCLISYTAGTVSNKGTGQRIMDLGFDGSDMACLWGGGPNIAGVFIQNCDNVHIERCRFVNFAASPLVINMANQSPIWPGTEPYPTYIPATSFCENPHVVFCEFVNSGRSVSLPLVTLAQSITGSGSSQTVNFTGTLPSGFANSAVVRVGFGTTAEEQVTITGFTQGAGSGTLTGIFLNNHSNGDSVSGLRWDACGGGTQRGGVYAFNRYDGCYGSAIDIVTAFGCQWFANHVVNANPETGTANSGSAGAIRSDFGSQETTIRDNVLVNSGSIILTGTISGTTYNGMTIENNTLYNSGAIFLSTDGAHPCYNNVVRKNNIIAPAVAGKAIALFGQLYADVTENFVANPLYDSSNNGTHIYLAQNGADGGSQYCNVTKNRLIDTRTDTSKNAVGVQESYPAGLNMVTDNFLPIIANTQSTAKNFPQTTAAVISRWRGNRNYNPPSPTFPAVPASGTALANPTNDDAMVSICTGAGVTVSAVSIDGSGLGATAQIAASSYMIVHVPFNGTITLTYAGGTPTWAWFPD